MPATFFQQNFYANHFIPKMPSDTAMTPISRTVGTDRVVDEMVFEFTHTIAAAGPTAASVEIAELDSDPLPGDEVRDLLGPAAAVEIGILRARDDDGPLAANFVATLRRVAAIAT